MRIHSMRTSVMENPALVSAIGKLAMAGEKAGFTVEQMIRILNNGFSVEELVELIESRLQKQGSGVV